MQVQDPEKEEPEFTKIDTGIKEEFEGDPNIEIDPEILKQSSEEVNKKAVPYKSLKKTMEEEHRGAAANTISDNIKDDLTGDNGKTISFYRDDKVVNTYISKNINKIKLDADDNYLIKAIIDNYFKTFIFDGKVVITDKREGTDKYLDVSKQQIQYLLDKYILSNKNEKKRLELREGLRARLLSDMNLYYYPESEEKGKASLKVPAMNSITNTLLKLSENPLSSKSSIENIKQIPNIKNLQSTIDKINLNNITQPEMVDIAKQWNDILDKDPSITNLGAYMGYNSLYNKQRAKILQREIFDSNPAFDKKTNRFNLDLLGEIVPSKGRKRMTTKELKQHLQSRKDIPKQIPYNLKQTIFDILKS